MSHLSNRDTYKVKEVTLSNFTETEGIHKNYSSNTEHVNALEIRAVKLRPNL